MWPGSRRASPSSWPRTVSSSIPWDPDAFSTGRSAAIDAAQAESFGVSVEEVLGGVEARILLGRYGTPEELARVAVFLTYPADAGVWKCETA